ncbi:beta-lactamase regulator AmpE [Paraferrimonas haliotis]|uniref:Beta-lactamase regulator AmpE n=1 Tax=Paraferrimonas haliotis TaxID=2013866 RepID=A0AA37WVC7_9GAMM|nr:beta-lactamase regulator AmpE [Paraferrimonas haliotis]GLS82263.1 beta-lactamase regulator AmpE [Paraferrimonas haliotis]
MALFSVLLALLLERMRLVSDKLGYQAWHSKFQAIVFDNDRPPSDARTLVAIVVPATVLYLLLSAVEGLLWGSVSLAIWTLVAVVLLNHAPIRENFSQYIKAACRKDSQACYHYAQRLDPHTDIESIEVKHLGRYIGETTAWINYRYFAAVVIYFAVLGPVAALLYSSLRSYSDSRRLSNDAPAWLTTAMSLADWIPSRLVSFGYMLAGHFSSAWHTWQKQALHIDSSARNIIGEVALAAEALPVSTQAECNSDAPQQAVICVESTVTLLKLARRNFILLLVVISLLTIFGVIQ